MKNRTKRKIIISMTTLMFAVSCKGRGEAEEEADTSESEDADLDDYTGGEDEDHPPVTEGELYQPCHRKYWYNSSDVPGDQLEELYPGHAQLPLSKAIGRRHGGKCLPLTSEKESGLEFEMSHSLYRNCSLNNDILTCQPHTLKPGVVLVGKVHVCSSFFIGGEKFILNIELQNI